MPRAGAETGGHALSMKLRKSMGSLFQTLFLKGKRRRQARPYLGRRGVSVQRRGFQTQLGAFTELNGWERSQGSCSGQAGPVSSGAAQRRRPFPSSWSLSLHTQRLTSFGKRWRASDPWPPPV